MRDLGKPGDLTGPDGLLKRLTAALVEGVLDGELTEHLGYPKHGSDEKAEGNSRNGHSKKRLRSDQGPLEIEVPATRPPRQLRPAAGEFGSPPTRATCIVHVIRSSLRFDPLRPEKGGRPLRLRTQLWRPRPHSRSSRKPSTR